MTAERTVALCGLGTVGGGLLRLLLQRADDLRDQHGLALRVVAATDSRGGALDADGLSLPEVLAVKSRGGTVAQLRRAGRPGAVVTALLDELDAAGARADLLVVAPPSDLSAGGTGLAAVRAGRARGMGVVLADKAPLVLAWDEVTGAAAAGARAPAPVRYSACVGAALPTVDLARAVLTSATATRIEVVLNSTCQRVLGDVEEGHDVEEAVRRAQRAGVAEADPSMDVEGTDTAVKLVILAASLGHVVALSDVPVTGISGLSGGSVRAERAAGRRVVLLGTAEPGEGRWRLRVEPASLDGDHPLARMSRHETGLVVHTDVAGSITASGRHDDATPTAAAVLRDLVVLAGR